MSEPNPEPTPAPAPVPIKPKKPKKQTKADRLFDAAQAVLDAVEEARAKADEFNATIEQAKDELEGLIQNISDNMETLRGVREEEYQGWYDNMSEGLQASPTGEKLSALLEIDLEPAMPEVPELDEINFEDAESAAQEILDAEIPVGFGRD